MKKLITILFVLFSFAASSQIVRANRYYVPVKCSYFGSDSTPSAIYSFRQVAPCKYNGNCVKVRRSSDNTTSIFGFVSGFVDTAGIKTFISTSDAFVETWYDQSGNSRDVTQATTGQQPKIATAGALIYSSTALAMQFDGSNDILVYSLSPAIQLFTFFGVSKRTGAALDIIAVGQSLSSGVAALINNNSTTQALAAYNVTTAGAGTSNTNLNFCAGVFTTTSLFATDGTATATTATSVAAAYDRLSIGGIARGVPVYTAGQVSEAVAYFLNMTSSYTRIQSNMKSYYGL